MDRFSSMNASLPRLGVVVVAYLSQPTITRCLAAPLLSGPTALEVIVVDNSPTDALRTMVEELPSRWPVTYLWPGSNLGFGKACNIGLELVTAPMTLFLNPDAWIESTDLAACIDRLEDDEKVGILGCRLIKPDGSLDHACKRHIPTVRSAVRHMLWKGGRSSYRASEIDEFSESIVGAVNGAFMLGRTDTLRSIGGFDARFWMYAEDIDLCKRVADTGKQVLYYPRATAMHVKGFSAGKVRGWTVHREFYRSMELYCRKYPDCHRPIPRTITILGIRLTMISTYAFKRIRAWAN